MLNSVKTRNKQSNVEKKLNFLIILILLIQITLCLILSVLSIEILKTDENTELRKFLSSTNLTSTQGFVNFLTFFILLNTMIPISLMVSLEIVKQI